MSGHHFHVHGAHDHAVEHAAQGGDNFASKVAVMTAILSTAGAFFGYQGGSTQNDALLFKNEAAIKKTEASNQWSYYQAKSNKQNLAELSTLLTTGEQKEKYIAEIERYKTEKVEIKAKADALEAASKDAEKRSDAAMHVHHRWAQAMTAMQIAISLAAIALLSRKRWLNYSAIGVALAGVGIAALAFLHI